MKQIKDKRLVDTDKMEKILKWDVTLPVALETVCGDVIHVNAEVTESLLANGETFWLLYEQRYDGKFMEELTREDAEGLFLEHVPQYGLAEKYNKFFGPLKGYEPTEEKEEEE